MRADRMSHAIDTGAFAVPATGPIAVFGPVSPVDVAPLPRERLQIISRYRPDHDAFVAAGYDVAQTARHDAAMALVYVSRARDATRAMIAEAADCLAPGAPMVIDGQKLDGIDSIIRDLRPRARLGEAVAKAHGRLIMATDIDGTGWHSMAQRIEGGFVTRPGVFSADAPDPASVLLADALPTRIGRRVVDLGAGWGYLSRAILQRDAVERLDLVEADGVAVDCARENITDPRAQFHWADATVFRPELPADAVVCNPPFHTSRQADPGLGIAFIQAARRMLALDGALWLVANRHLPYDAVLASAFRDVTEFGGNKAFRLIKASRPQRIQRST